MLDAGHDLPLCRAVAGKLVGDHHTGRPADYRAGAVELSGKGEFAFDDVPNLREVVPVQRKGRARRVFEKSRIGLRGTLHPAEWAVMSPTAPVGQIWFPRARGRWPR